MRAAVAGFARPSSTTTKATLQPPAADHRPPDHRAQWAVPRSHAPKGSYPGAFATLQILLDRDGRRPDQVEDAPVLRDLRLFLQVEGADMRLQVDHVGVVLLGEVENAERAGHRRVRPDRPGQHPDLDADRKST